MVLYLRFLVTSDFHGRPEAAENLETFLEEDYDGVFLLGDLTQFGPPSQASDFLDITEEADISTFALPGNCDPEELVDVLEQKGVNFHAKSVSLGGVSFLGFGGSDTTPFGTIFEFDDSDILRELRGLAGGMKGDWVLLTHAPPYGTEADLSSRGSHVGSKAIRKIIDEFNPLANICGHIHESRGVDRIDGTWIVNTGPIFEGYAAELILGDEVEVKLLEL